MRVIHPEVYPSLRLPVAAGQSVAAGAIARNSLTIAFSAVPVGAVLSALYV